MLLLPELWNFAGWSTTLHAFLCEQKSQQNQEIWHSCICVEVHIRVFVLKITLHCHWFTWVLMLPVYAFFTCQMSCWVCIDIVQYYLCFQLSADRIINYYLLHLIRRVVSVCLIYMFTQMSYTCVAMIFTVVNFLCIFFWYLYSVSDLFTQGKRKKGACGCM